VYDMTGGEGEFAVLSATSTATNQNSWIAAMEQIIESDDKYADLVWVETVYGDDESQKSYDQTESLLTNYPDLEVICCPTTVGILACAQAVQNAGSSVKVAGLGLPSEMNGYVGDDLPCPYMYLWNPIDVGATAAYAIQCLIDGDTTGAVGETFTAANGSEYEVIEGDESVGVYSMQIIVGPPYEFTADNIEEWAEIY
ncbi:MAG: substrate-binding domain-containing protein, partial [Lachnospiraceae bacterium]|nr:substrate-binding domain-containing protein [Lachnospiraceae bacterium]